MDPHELVSRLDRVMGPNREGQYNARCPSHDDRVASLSVGPGDNGGIVLNCKAMQGCTPQSIVAALGLTMMDLAGTPHVVATYDYIDLNGVLRYSVQRWHPKDFRCVPGLPQPSERILYNLQAVEWANTNGYTIYYCEGEKDVDALASLHVPATTHVGGASAWFPHYAEQLAGAHVVFVADNDDPGRDLMRRAAAATKPYAASVSLVHSPVGKDVSDLLAAGYDLDRLQPLPLVDSIGVYQASSLKPGKVEWAWLNRFAFGNQSVVESDPGTGKSLASIDWAQRWSTGAPMPDGSPSGGPFPVVMVSAEDDAETIIIPRLIAAGADLDLVHLVTHGPDPSLPFDFQYLNSLADFVQRVGARVVFFDPMMAFVATTVDTNNDHSVRRGLAPVRMFAATTNAAVIMIRHLNKSAGSKAMYRGGGSIGITGFGRATYQVSKMSDGLRVLAEVKNNLAPETPSLGFRVESNNHGQPFVTWTGVVDMTAQQALDRAERPAVEEDDVDEIASMRQARRLERQFLADLLTEHGPMSWLDIVAHGKAEGFSESTLRRARADLKLSKQHGVKGNASTLWSLVGPAPATPTPKPSAAPQPQPQPAAEDEDDPETRFMLAPDECEICKSTDVLRFAEPWWTVRCEHHDPTVIGR